MRIQFSIMAVALLCAAAVAQPSGNLVEIFPGGLNRTSRGDVGAKAGEILQGFHASHWRGLGDTGQGCEIKVIRSATQDENPSTQETYFWKVRRGTDANGPAVGVAGEIASLGPFQTPPSTVTKPAAWFETTFVSYPMALPDCSSHFSVGQALAAAPNWPNDGQSTHIYLGTEQGSNANQGDHAWQILAGASSASHPPQKRSWRYGMHFSTAVLQLGTSAMYGMGGMFPKAGNPLSARATYGSALASGASLLWLGTDRIGGISLFGGTARLYLGGVVVPLGAAIIDGQGQATHTIIGALPASVSGAGTFHVQAAGLSKGGGIVMLTNCHSVTP
jgi:hypothetical protein